MIYRNYVEAHEAAQKMKTQHIANGIMVKVEKSVYGGYQIKLIPLDLMIDNLSNNAQNERSRTPVAC